MARLSELPIDKPITVEPIKAFPVVKDLITDVSWNFEVKKRIKKFKPRPPDAPDGTWRMQQEDIDRVQEFRKCIECFLCQDVCHVLRDHHMHDRFVGPRFLIYTAALEMHPLDVEDRTEELRNAHGIGYCNITKCCTKVCPENIEITDNGIIPLKERVVDKFYDPLGWIWRWLKRTQDLLREAMNWFEKAEQVRPTGNDDALLRWNTCARIIARNNLVPREEERIEFPLE
jgi:succinate dehydrogenase / fumarate reductase iron-sulfur subunit